MKSKTEKPAAASRAPRLAVAIMAAGKGTRLKSRLPKVLHEIGGKPLLLHVIEAAKHLVSASEIYAIVGHESNRVMQAVAHAGIGFVMQAEQRGTGHAVMVARAALENYDHVLVLSGDAPLISPDTLARLRDAHYERRAAMTLLSALPPDPTGYGRVIHRKKNGRAIDEVVQIVEEKSLTPAQRKANVREINAGFYAFALRPLFANIDRLKTENAHREFYLTDMAEILSKAKERVIAVPATNDCEVLGINTRAELAQLDAKVRDRKCAELMACGVTIYRPETCVIDADVQIGADTVIEPFVQLLGKTKVGSDCRIRSYSVISNSELSDGVTVRPGCIVDKSSVAARAILGPYSHLRPDSNIGEDAHVGNFVETKKTRLGKGSKANHLTYLGDTEIGDGVNVGAGTITCNYDGAHKHRTVIEDGAFIGSDSTLVAPVRVGKNAYVGAGSCITEDIPEDALAVGRARQVNKEGWVKARREGQTGTKK